MIECTEPQSCIRGQRGQFVYVYVNENLNVYVDIYANAMQCKKWTNASPKRRKYQKQKGNKKKTFRNSVTGKTS